MKKITNFFVGVDVSKNWLDIYIHPKNEFFRISNCFIGITKLLQTLSIYKIERIVCESSGGYENLLLDLCREAQYKIWQVDPKRIRAFIISEGIKAKTDKIDAKMIALFASQKEPKYDKHKTSLIHYKLRALVQRRTDLTNMAAMEKKRLNGPTGLYCKENIQNILKIFSDNINILDIEIQKIIDEDDDMNNRKQILESIPGVGKTTAANLIAHMPELGTVENKQAAALLGVAPYTKQSGIYKGQEIISGGRFAPRCALYMAALAACRYNPVMKNFYSRLRNTGKKPKVAVVAVMNKLIVTINAMCKKNMKWVHLPIS